jgi:ABC-type transporter Mla MlaB component
VFRTEVDCAITDPGPAARTIIQPGPAARIAKPGPAARVGRVISLDGPQPPQLGGGDSPVYDDGVLRITRVTGPGLAPGPAPGLGSGDLQAGYALAGEIDESTVGGLAGKLAEIAAGLDEVHLDLAALDYSDLAGLRVIVQLAGPGRRVVLHRVPPHLRAILGIVGWDGVPGVEVAS